MKKIILILLAVVLFSAGTAVSFAESNTKVVAYYFHTTFRCASCHKIEKYTEGSIKEYFGKELSSGKLAFDIVNVDKKENEHFVKEYQLYTKSVVLSLVKDGKEVKHKNLDKVWEYLRNKDTFYAYIKSETKAFLDASGKEEMS